MLQTAGIGNLSTCLSRVSYMAGHGATRGPGGGGVANKTAPAVTRETRTGGEKGEEVGPEDKLSGPREYSWTILG